MSTKAFFIYPFNGPTTTIALRRPIFGDQRTVNYQTVAKRSRSGQLYTYRRSPTYVTLKLVFEHLRSASVQGMSSQDAVQEFFRVSAAQQVRYIDHNGQHWQCTVLTPAIDYTNQGKDAYGDLFGFTIELDAFMLVGQSSGPVVGNR